MLCRTEPQSSSEDGQREGNLGGCGDVRGCESAPQKSGGSAASLALLASLEATNAETEDQCPLRVVYREAEILQVGVCSISHGTEGTVQASRCSARVGLWSTTGSGCRRLLCRRSERRDRRMLYRSNSFGRRHTFWRFWVLLFRGKGWC